MEIKKESSILAHYDEIAPEIGKPKEITVTNYGRDVTLTIVPAGFAERIMFQTKARVTAGADDDGDAQINAAAYAAYVYDTLAAYVTEIAELEDYELQSRGCGSRAQFAEKFFDRNITQMVFNQIMGYGEAVEQDGDDAADNHAETIKN